MIHIYSKVIQAHDMACKLTSHLHANRANNFQIRKIKEFELNENVMDIAQTFPYCAAFTNI